jgi:Holliday junction resolvase RusA-like endonuclease
MIHRELPTQFLYPITSPIKLSILAEMPIPGSMRKRDIPLALSGELKHTKSFDVDNAAKAMLDCLTGILYVDDRQIYALAIQKQYSETPGWSLKVEW